jgi:8-oxo-dGTP pyrophosphatase MutT (NUDIX family)
MSSGASHIPNLQYAALPWRRRGGALEVLLITTRNTRRWIIPKGWPIESHTPSECAALEALEEAGVVGEVSAHALGLFRYNKERESGETTPCIVRVFTMEIIEQRKDWIEKSERETLWCSLPEALARVKEPGLRRLIAKFARQRIFVNAA